MCTRIYTIFILVALPARECISSWMLVRSGHYTREVSYH
jgi:hypothetical protein